MSTNCLLTKLKGVVDDSSLPKFGSLEIQFNEIPNADIPSNGKYNTVIVKASSTQEVEIIGDSQFYQDIERTIPLGKTRQISGGNTKNVLFMGNGNFKLVVPKYDLKSLVFDSVLYKQNVCVDFNDYKYVNFTELTCGGNPNASMGFPLIKPTLVGGSVLDINPNVEILNIGDYANSDRIYTVSELNSHFTNLKSFGYTGDNITGDLSEFSNLQNKSFELAYARGLSVSLEAFATTLNTYNTEMNIGYTKAYGNIEPVLEAWYSRHTISGSTGYFYINRHDNYMYFKNTLVENTPLNNNGSSSAITCYLKRNGSILEAYGGRITKPTDGTTPTATYNGTTWTYNF